jgi:hypothetical protein
MLRIAYYLLTRKEMYVDLGKDYFDKQKQVIYCRHSVRRLENLGYTVTITEASYSIQIHKHQRSDAPLLFKKMNELRLFNYCHF